jgi:hypothetical protein
LDFTMQALGDEVGWLMRYTREELLRVGSNLRNPLSRET